MKFKYYGLNININHILKLYRRNAECVCVIPRENHIVVKYVYEFGKYSLTQKAYVVETKKEAIKMFIKNIIKLPHIHRITEDRQVFIVI